MADIQQSSQVVAQVESQDAGNIVASQVEAQIETSGLPAAEVNQVIVETEYAPIPDASVTFLFVEVEYRVPGNPVVDTFTLPAENSGLTVSVTTFDAHGDGVSLTGYMVTESSSPPAYDDPGWLSSAPTTITASGYGLKTFYPWVRDELNQVSDIYGSGVQCNIIDEVPPEVTDFAIPSTSASLTFPVGTFTATDNVGVVGYMITESATPPAADAPGWLSSAPTTITASSEGAITFYPWVKDNDGNVSDVYGSPQTCTITIVIGGMQVRVTAGTVRFSGQVYSIAEQTFPVTTAPGSGYRYDIIVVGDDRVMDYIEGTAATPPIMPATPVNHLLVGWILVPKGKTEIIATDINAYYVAPRVSSLEIIVADSDLAWTELTTTITVKTKDQFGNYISNTSLLYLEFVRGNGSLTAPGGSTSRTKVGAYYNGSSLVFIYTRDQLDPGDSSPTIRATLDGTGITNACMIILRNINGDPMA